MGRVNDALLADHQNGLHRDMAVPACGLCPAVLTLLPPPAVGGASQ